MINGYIYDNQAAEVGYQKTGTVPLEEAGVGAHVL